MRDIRYEIRGGGTTRVQMALPTKDGMVSIPRQTVPEHDIEEQQELLRHAGVKLRGAVESYEARLKACGHSTTNFRRAARDFLKLVD